MARRKSRDRAMTRRDLLKSGALLGVAPAAPLELWSKVMPQAQEPMAATQRTAAIQSAMQSAIQPAMQSAATGSSEEGFRSLKVDAGKVVGRIRSFQGLNGPPSPVMAGLPNLVEQFRELRVDQVRTHDFMGPTEIDSRYAYRDVNLVSLIPDPAQRIGVVKTGNESIIFPDWNADAEKAESYRFGPTDKVIAAIRESGAEVYYRIGRSW